MFQYLLVWHNVPVKPAAQVQVNVLIPSAHTPLLRQGLLAQSLMSVEEIKPEINIFEYWHFKYDVGKTYSLHTLCTKMQYTLKDKIYWLQQNLIYQSKT